MSSSSSSTSSTSTLMKSSRPSFVHSETMPAFRRALSLSSMDKSFASLRKSSTKGLRRISSFRKPTAPARGPEAFLSPSTESIPTFTTPDYKQPASSCVPPAPSISPLTRPGGAFKRSLTMPAPVRALAKQLPGLKKICEFPPPSRESVSSSSTQSTVSDDVSASSLSSGSTGRRRSSVCSVESFNSTEERVTLGLRLCALPSTLMGIFSSVVSVFLILVLPAMAPETPKRKPARRSYEREIILTEEQLLNPPRLPSSTLSSRLSHRLTRSYRRTLHRVARARRAQTTRAALTALFALTPKRVRATIPTPVDPMTLLSDVPLAVYTSPIALPLPKGPAPVVLPARRPSRTKNVFSARWRKNSFAGGALPTLSEEEDGPLCAGW